MGRKKIGSDNKRSGLQTFRLTPAEHERFVALAASLGTDRSKILVKIVRELINGEPHLNDDQLTAFRQATKQVMAIGRNLNQITKAVHEGKAPRSLHNERYYQAILGRISVLEKGLLHFVESSKNRWVLGDVAGE